MKLEYILSAGMLLSLMAICVIGKKLTPAGAIAAGIIGAVVYAATGMQGIILLLTFFILSVLATAHRKAEKIKIDVAHSQSGGRNAGQVFANGGVAALMALLIIFDPIHEAFYAIMMACSLSSALSDTLSSELGIVYGTKYYNILSFKKDKNGLNGVVSLEGSLFGFAGAGFVGIASSGFTAIAAIITFSGFLGNLSDSYLGATLERRLYIGNDVVNFVNTTIASLIGLLLYRTVITV